MSAVAEPSPVTIDMVRHELRNVAMALRGRRYRLDLIAQEADIINDLAEHGFISSADAITKIQALRKEHGL